MYVDFKITKVHRDVNNFKFEEPMFNPKDYDKTWFFGMSQDNSPLSLTHKKLRIISQFMDNGGGVFATGDHEDIGKGLCAEIPRVRSMRKWHFPEGENGYPVAPPVGIKAFDADQ